MSETNKIINRTKGGRAEEPKAENTASAQREAHAEEARGGRETRSRAGGKKSMRARGIG
jgi:hypothetical protein